LTPGVRRLQLGKTGGGGLSLRFDSPAACLVRNADASPEVAAAVVDSPEVGAQVFEFAVEFE
jgi:hypothetical protein